MDKICAIYN